MQTPPSITTALLFVAAVQGCAGSETPPPKPTPGGEATLKSGGQLDVGQLPTAPVSVDGGRLVAWGVSDVPAGSRLPAAEAMAAAAARAELAEFLGSRIANAMAITETDSGAVDIATATTELAAALLPGLDPPTHGWAQIQREDAVVLRVVARLVVAPEQLAQAASTTGSLPFAADVEKVRDFIDRIVTPEASEAD